MAIPATKAQTNLKKKTSKGTVCDNELFEVNN